ncbi:MAG: DUF2934 domain-containing protein [Nitrospira sp.]|nr:DUF2934 domain-containing protein [Nitrospira sp.]MDR4483941.1 DUF2934 domain-containing protein [Nitrospirales bacterium]
MGKKGRTHQSNETKVPVNEQDQEESIRTLAYQLFCESGYQHGHDQEHWLEAERCVFEKSQKK